LAQAAITPQVQTQLVCGSLLAVFGAGAMFSCGACNPADQTTDVVKFDASAIAREQELAEQREREREQAEREQQKLTEAARRAELEQRRLQEEQEEARRQAEAEERQRAMEREQEEQERAAREREEATQRAEQTRSEMEAAEARARRASVTAFLKEKGFKGGAAGPKKSLMSTTYPLHTAAKEGNAAMVEMLLKEGADLAQKNSAGKTALQVAEKSDKGGSHATVLAALGGRAPAGRAGGC